MKIYTFLNKIKDTSEKCNFYKILFQQYEIFHQLFDFN